MCISLNLLSRLHLTKSTNRPTATETSDRERHNSRDLGKVVDDMAPEPSDATMHHGTTDCEVPDSREINSDDSLPVYPSASGSNYSQPIQANDLAPTGSTIPYAPYTALSDITEEDEEDTTTTMIERDDMTDIAPFRLEPARLDNLPPNVLKKILRHVFTIGDTIIPWFNLGFLDLGARGVSYNDSHVTFRPNLDLAFLRLNKACYRAGTDILYGENHFRFERAELCLWWLRRIGENNINKLRMVTFILNTGWRHDLRDPKIEPCALECSHEKNWAKCLNLVRLAHPKLDYFYAATVFWTPMEMEPMYDEASKDELRLWRKVIFDTIAKFRDVKTATLEQFGDEYVSTRELMQLELLMQQRGSTRPDTPPAPVMSFAERMARVKAQNEESMRCALEEVEKRKARSATAARRV